MPVVDALSVLVNPVRTTTAGTLLVTADALVASERDEYECDRSNQPHESEHSFLLGFGSGNLRVSVHWTTKVVDLSRFWPCAIAHVATLLLLREMPTVGALRTRALI